MNARNTKVSNMKRYLILSNDMGVNRRGFRKAHNTVPASPRWSNVLKQYTFLLGIDYIDASHKVT